MIITFKTQIDNYSMSDTSTEYIRELAIDIMNTVGVFEIINITFEGISMQYDTFDDYLLFKIQTSNFIIDPLSNYITLIEMLCSQWGLFLNRINAYD